ncbi:HTH-type transcriptional regulatory protein GabR [Tritonibacter multivorans]|uniref:HTH-type transcriptional regulatory protein GabR n=1 Tax=Tritonibacter multivorans TaxID=928856 RepID=A0A0P1GZP5_9RHOB|nr:PLP-dependent aminotransferase family protein [Tritonibacter multivorans]MDA7421622.1 PLP-dependent aminotransferase family protein [Tritonibacter multivorans]CUH82063.1 HTH-type transcriptional regulatory protein GabR [Tritonibacter multivorans]SFC93583.1 transcriptional regulator, GntR family [Tritonibacter multivorans]
MKNTAWLAFEIDRSAKTPVFEQICAFIRTRAVSGDLPEGSKLPASREFAAQLGVSRPTVVTAYEQLLAEGYVRSRVGSGYFLCDLGEVELPAAPKAASKPDPARAPNTPKPFEYGQPDMRLFPHRQWAKSVAKVCRSQPESMLTGGTDFGNLALRRAIADYVSEWRGISAVPDQIAITAGSSDALELCMRTLSQRGDAIGLEDPGYLPASAFAQAQGLSKVHLPVDDQGACLPARGETPSLVVLTPSHQYPLGGSMSPNRRLDFIRWANDRGGWIVEDDYDSEFRYAGRPIPALAGFDHLRRTIYVGSFSKIFSNTLRLGYVILPEPLVPQFHDTFDRFRPKASLMPQAALADYISSGAFYRHLRRVRRIYGQRRKLLLDRLRQDFADFGHFQDHQAGMQLVFHLNPPFHDIDIAAKAARLGVRTPPLSAVCAKAQGRNGLMLGFSGFDEDEITAALDLLHSCFVAETQG